MLWLVWMMTIVLFQGFGGTGNPEISGQLFGLSYTFKEPRWFSLSDSVLIALISGTTISVFGFFAAVMNYLFPKRKD